MHDVNKATINTSAILAVYIYKGENSAIAIDANERRHAHELNFFPHPSSTHQAKSNGQTLMNNEPQHKQRKMKRNECPINRLQT
jgi:hypothetical protein